MRIFLLGLPGAGKGTQGKALSHALQIPHISLGDRARELARSGTGELADSIRVIHRQGKWQPLPTDIAVALFEQECPARCVVDGFPRDLQQHRSITWDDHRPNDQRRNIFVHLKISEDESRRRVWNRNRSGDSLQKWEARMKLERDRLPELLNRCALYDGCGHNWISLIEVNGKQEPECVTQEILSHPVLKYCLLSESDQELVMKILDPYDLCSGSVFNLNSPEERLADLFRDGRSLKEQWEAMFSPEEAEIKKNGVLQNNDDSDSVPF